MKDPSETFNPLVQASSRIVNQNPPQDLAEQVTAILEMMTEAGVTITSEMLEDAYDTARAYHDEYLPHSARVNRLAHTLFGACADRLMLPFNAPEP